MLLVLAPTASLCATAPPAQPATEQEWILGEIAGGLVDLIQFHRDGREKWDPPPTGAVSVREIPAIAGGKRGVRYELKVDWAGASEATRIELVVSTSVWDPQLFVPFIHSALGRAPQAPAKDALPETPILTALTSPIAEELVTQNRRVSSWLTIHPTDAGAHEQAALLLGVLALRENSGWFWDPRHACNLAVAHLAFARTLRDKTEPSVSAALAELMIGLIIDTKADCEKRIAKLRERARQRPELSPWVNVATLRNSRDYRIIKNVEQATLLEQIEFFRAQCEAIDSRPASSSLLTKHFERTPDWSRILLQFGFSVGDGHFFSRAGLPLEYKEFTRIFPTDAARGQLEAQVAVLNKLPGGLVQRGSDGRAEIIVIDDGHWARFLQRHVLHVVCQTYYFLAYKWGVKEAAEEFRTKVVASFGTLALYPLAENYLIARSDTYAAPSSAALDLIKNHPEWVTDTNWLRLVESAKKTNASPVPDPKSFFSPAFPVGTALDFYTRWQMLPEDPAERLLQIKSLYAIAPLQYGVARQYVISKYSEHPAPAEFETVMAPFLDYYFPALFWQAELSKDKPEVFVRIYNRLAEADPNQFINLSKYLREHSRPDEAARTFQLAIDRKADAVWVANTCDWLVNYYFDRGETDRALAVAQMAAEVYSHGGLETMAKLMERMKRWDDAESYHLRIVDRYDSRGTLRAYYARRAKADPSSPEAEKLKLEAARAFPGGMQPASLEKLAAAGQPAKGVIMRGETELTRKAGIQSEAIIVALDGISVETVEQYVFVRALSDSPEMNQIVWQNGAYESIHAHVPGRRFGNKIFPWP
jgi:hypothetical protein